MVRLAFGVEYDGSELLGWQAQKEGRSVQGCLEQALSRVANEKLQVICAGRTDAGVHATAQVVHIETSARRGAQNWLLGGNSLLPRDISLNWVRSVDDRFHARFSARSRAYQYLILNRRERSGLWRRRTTWIREPLDIERMRAAAGCLLGKHDFSSFRAAACQANSPLRTVIGIDIARDGDLVSLGISANAFLHHMVRNIAGTLIDVGRGDSEVESVAAVLAAQDRCRAGMTASASGLYLVGVEYEKSHALPSEVVPVKLFRSRIESDAIAMNPQDDR